MKVITELLRRIGQSEFSRNQDQARARINEIQGYDTLRRIAAEFGRNDSGVILVEHTYELSPFIILAVHFGLSQKENLEKETWWKSNGVGVEANSEKVTGVRFSDSQFGEQWDYLRTNPRYNAYLGQRIASWKLENPRAKVLPEDIVNPTIEDQLRIAARLATPMSDYRYGKGHKSIHQRLGAAPKNWKII